MKKFWRLVIIAAVTFFLFYFVLTPARVGGRSMEPTYRDGQFIIVNRLAYLAREPGRGKIVAIKIAGRNLLFLKRTIGLPGETIEIRHGQVFIDGAPIEEPYLESPAGWSLPSRVLVADEYLVIGDNRRQSAEEHLFGRIDRRQIVGAPLW